MLISLVKASSDKHLTCLLSVYASGHEYKQVLWSEVIAEFPDAWQQCFELEIQKQSFFVSSPKCRRT